LRSWTEPSFSHHGEFFSVPPTYTKWNHKQTIAYFQQDDAGRRLEDVLAIGDPDMYSAGNPVQATTTTLKELQVFPQPLQKPHPQLWEPLTSARSLRLWKAKPRHMRKSSSKTGRCSAGSSCAAGCSTARSRTNGSP